MTAQRDVFGHASVAHSSLKGSLKSDRYSDGILLRVVQPVTNLTLKPNGQALDRQVLYGHPVRQLEPEQGLSRDETSGYVGYVSPDALATWVQPTHRVTARTTLLFQAPDIKSPGPVHLSQGTLLKIESFEGMFGRTIDGTYAIASHLSPIETSHPDLAATAKALTGTPYLWGGNSAFGIDCSGLVQMACQAAHIPCPGDSDQQCAVLGSTLPNGTTPQRNDLFFWPGHVALAYDENTLIHANAHHMAVAFEAITDALHRIDTSGNGPLIAHKRLTAVTNAGAR